MEHAKQPAPRDREAAVAALRSRYAEVFAELERLAQVPPDERDQQKWQELVMEEHQIRTELTANPLSVGLDYPEVTGTCDRP